MSLPNKELIDRAKQLAPRLKERARETELLRKPHEESINDLINAELLQILVPKIYGGHESDLRTLVEVSTALSSGCASTAWIASFYMGHNLFMTKFPEAAQKEVFADKPFSMMPAANAPTIKAKKATGGWEISGKAPWGSGVMHSEWVMLSGMTGDASARMFLVPTSEVQTDDVWNFSGMSGTGSNDIVVEQVFVPEHRTVDIAEFSSGVTEGSSIHTNPLYSVPMVPVAFCEIVGVMAGALQGAVDEFGHNAQNRVRAYTGSAVKEQPQVHITLGELQVRSMVANELALLQADMTHSLNTAGAISLEDRIRLKGHAAFLAQHCRESANLLISKSGSSSFHVDSPIQRHWRDINMLATHAFWDWDASREQLGRMFFDLPPNNPLI